MENDKKLFGEYSKMDNIFGDDLINSFSLSSESNETQSFSLPELDMLEGILEEDLFLSPENRSRRFSDTDYMLTNQVYDDDDDEDIFIDFYGGNFGETYMSLENVVPFPDRG
ncbi:Hypothetical protein SRAE_1000273800 [Strongyloides ratti]|uniref:Uncharacterized protein n=1 Tax=Strongyloides ratti TaxID=34506 RepID=A0A090MWY3_STRRB|nr:Hypothetical protein SRAE_1000273800 [Strongyloides ratti]CEF64484.1 Hypothetical protein SRAE_1000273800 [Strongyloides ratti]